MSDSSSSDRSEVDFHERKLFDDQLADYISRIYYSPRYSDDRFEYRHVIIPKPMFEFYVPQYYKRRLLQEYEWRQIGLCMSPGWIHYMLHDPEPHILLFKRDAPPIDFICMLPANIKDPLLSSIGEDVSLKLKFNQKILDIYQQIKLNRSDKNPTSVFSIPEFIKYLAELPELLDSIKFDLNMIPPIALVTNNKGGRRVSARLLAKTVIEQPKDALNIPGPNSFPDVVNIKQKERSSSIKSFCKSSSSRSSNVDDMDDDSIDLSEDHCNCGECHCSSIEGPHSDTLSIHSHSKGSSPQASDISLNNNRKIPSNIHEESSGCVQEQENIEARAKRANSTTLETKMNVKKSFDAPEGKRVAGRKASAANSSKPSGAVVTLADAPLSTKRITRRSSVLAAKAGPQQKQASEKPSKSRRRQSAPEITNLDDNPTKKRLRNR